jgi:hypothetical protein
MLNTQLHALIWGKPTIPQAINHWQEKDKIADNINL